MKKKKAEKTYTVKDASRKFGKCEARIRQICIKYEIGVCIADRIRILTKEDMDDIGAVIAEVGRDFSKNRKKD